MNVIRIISCLFGCLLAVGTHAQDYQLESISVTDGLSQSSVYTLAQDKMGFLWIGTQDGLNRYDGQNFQVYKKDPFDSTSISDNHISQLLVDHRNRLWVGTLRGGLNYFDPYTETFIRFMADGQQAGSIASNQVHCLYQDADYRLWVSTTKGVQEILVPDEVEQLREMKFQEPDWQRDAGIDGLVRGMAKDASGNFWLATYEGIFWSAQHPKPAAKAALARLDCSSVELEWKTEDAPFSIFETPDGQVWAIAAGKLYELNASREMLVPLSLTAADGKPLENIRHVLKLPNEHLLMIADRRLYRLAYQNDRYERKVEELILPSDPMYQLPGHQVLCMLADQLHEGLFWVGTGVSGLLKVSERKKKFNTHHLSELKQELGLEPTVFHIVEDSLNQWWLGLAQGLVKYKPESKSFTFFEKLDLPKEEEIPSKWMHRMYLDDKGTIWAGTAKGLMRIHQNEQTATAEPVMLEHGCEKRRVFSFFQDGGQLLLGSVDGLSIYDLKKDEPANCFIEIENKSAGQPHFRINAIHKDRNKNLWLGSSHGLILYRNVTDYNKLNDDYQPAFYYYDEHDKHSLIENLVNDVLEDEQGRIWVATMNGLSRAVVKDEGVWFESFNEGNGLANNVIYGMLEDTASQSLWLSTNNGLCRFDYDKNRIDNFDVHDGLQSNEFNGGAFFKNSKGCMFFGGIAGITHFFPDEIQSAKHRPPVWISKLSIGDGPSYNLLPDPAKKPLVLQHSQNTFSVDFVGLDYLYPHELRYFYDLDGGSAKDMPIGNNRQIYFNELAPGTYNLRVKAISKDGIANPLGDSIQFTILTPFWKTGWFYLALVLTLLLVSWWVYHMLYRMKMQRLAEIESVRKLAAQDFHDELGSKLSIISMYSELTKKQLGGTDKQVPGYLNKVITTSNSLYDSMKDLLWALNPEQDTIHDLFLNLKDFGEELYSHSDIEFQSTGMSGEWADQQLPMQYKRHILLIFKEAMNNSLRHSGASVVSLCMSNNDGVLTVKVTDNGSGFDVETASKGEGLNNMKSRARKIKGQLLVQSSAAGSTVQLDCPPSV